MKKAVVIFSGGQDSTTCLFWAVREFDEVEAITFNYGQKHEVELKCAANICLAYGIKQTIIDISFLQTIVDSALTSNAIPVGGVREDGLPATYVPNRNQLFITLAHAYAQKIGANQLVTGVCETDYSGYPDCRQHFISGMESVSNYGSGAFIRIHTPLMFRSKAEIFALAEELGVLSVVVEHSHTCYNGSRLNRFPWGYGCGTCGACTLRAQGWNDYTKNIETFPH